MADQHPQPNDGQAEDDLFGGNGLLARTEAKLLAQLDSRPEDARLLLKLATVRRRRGNIPAALETYRRVTTLRPDLRLAPYTRAVLSGADLRHMPVPKGNVPTPFQRRHSFLSAEECDALLRLVAAHQARFVPARVVDENSQDGLLKQEIRQASVVKEQGLRDALQWLEPKLSVAAEEALERLPVLGFDFESHELELNVTAHGNGDYFRVHQDASRSMCPERRLSFVYYFHRQPRQFSGGDLLLYDTDRQLDRFEMGVFTRIEPIHNSIIFFPSRCFHEITPVGGVKDFADARFTVNGWFTTPSEGAAPEET